MQNDLRQELGTNWIEYAVAVNTDRSIPDAKSGLKPVAKRILWAAKENNYTSAKAHVKCAKIVGDVMGTYHPHGDSSIYGAMVRLAQPWVMRYPLIDWHGNKGTQGGDGPASMRYTEARLAKISEDGLLSGIKKRNVDFIPNYDETKEEPVTLPAIFPNLLCNPNSGIGVAMACNWLPHNLNEVADAIKMYLAGEEPTLPGPDFPTGGIIINKNDIPNILKSGHGSIKLRGKYKVEKQNIVFYEIPYGCTIEGLLAEIGKVSDEKAVEGIVDVRNESNKNGIRIVIECGRNENPDIIAKKLYTKTNLQTSISYNQIALIGKTPTEMNLKDCIEVYVEHNLECIRREIQFDLNKAEARMHIVDGLLKALEDIDNIIKLIKTSASAAAAKDALMNTYKFTEVQAKAILDMKLAKLANLEKVELQDERDNLYKDIERFQSILKWENKQKEILIERLDALVKKYGDARRTELTHIDIKPSEKEIAEVVPEDCVVVMTQAGNIKRVPKNSFKAQRRNGKGIKTQDDILLGVISTNTVDTLMLFTNKGKMYRLVVDNVPVGTNAGKGVGIGSLIPIDADETVIAVTSLYRKTNAKYVVFITKNGLIKKTALEEYTSTKRTTGIIAIKIKEGDSIANVTFLDTEDLFLITKQGIGIHFSTVDIAAIGRNTSGVKGIKLGEGDEVVVGLPLHSNEDTLAIFSNKGTGKRMKLTEIPKQGRGGKGVKISEDTIGGAAMVDDTDTVLVIGRPNSICISAKDMPILSRTAVGNAIIKASQIAFVAKF